MKKSIARGIFVTGTDTGVGKTLVSAAILSAMRDEGLDYVPMKPVQTGCQRRRGKWVAPDLEFCLTTAGLKPGSKERADMAPYCFQPACSPHLAAREAGVTISVSKVKAAICRLARAHDGVVVEGAGGVLVPLNARQTMLDLMVVLGLPVVLVARPGLGTLNHTLLSLHLLRGAGLSVLGVVLNQSSPGRWGKIENDNARTIERMGKVKVLACMRFQEESRS
ncbi:MAG: dethiobiotin synthase [bacterium]